MTKDTARLPSGIDWEHARQRLARADRVISGDSTQSPEEARRVLEERARELARPIIGDAEADSIEVLTFALGGERFALEARFVLAATRLEHITIIPSAEPPLVGLTAWRGELLTLFDLRILTGTSARALSDLSWVVVLGEGSAAFGVLVDALHPVVRLPIAEIQPLPGPIRRAREHVGGVTSEALLVLDAGGLIRTYS